MKTIKFILRLVVDTYTEWSRDRAERLGAALAYYALFSIAPLLLIMITIAGAVYGDSAASGQIVSMISGKIGPEAAKGIEQMLAGIHSSGSGSGLLPTILSVLILVFGATNLFIHLRNALNTLWYVRPKPTKNIFGGILDFARERVISILMVIAFSLILIMVLALSAGLTALNSWLKAVLTANTYFLLEAGYVLATLGMTTLLFGLIFKLLPDARPSWQVVWVSSLVTSILFNIGVFLIGLYLGVSGSQSALGAAGSIVVIMLWVYYSAQIFFLGAKFARVYASAVGKPILPDTDGVSVRSKQPAAQSQNINE